ncbi:uncharacterized protein LOC108223246 [Daucus carota subsp. sativus]|nr:PREDICTED: uncharacterized protein LOC108223246 [Daucus carota subsp. sativus]
MGSLFIRCYMSAGDRKRVRFETKEVSSSNMAWNQSFSFDCFGPEESVSNMLLEGSVMFELRRRCGTSFFGRTGKSQLLGKAEVPWNTVYESSTMDIEKWIVMNPKRRLPEGVKPPAIEVGMRVTGAQKALNHRKSSGGEILEEREIFALDAALEFSCY